MKMGVEVEMKMSIRFWGIVLKRHRSYLMVIWLSLWSWLDRVRIGEMKRVGKGEGRSVGSVRCCEWDDDIYLDFDFDDFNLKFDFGLKLDFVLKISFPRSWLWSWLLRWYWWTIFCWASRILWCNVLSYRPWVCHLGFTWFWVLRYRRVGSLEHTFWKIIAWWGHRGLIRLILSSLRLISFWVWLRCAGRWHFWDCQKGWNRKRSRLISKDRFWKCSRGILRHFWVSFTLARRIHLVLAEWGGHFWANRVFWSYISWFWWRFLIFW